LTGWKELFGPRHGKEVLHNLGHQRGNRESSNQLEGTGPAPQHQEDQANNPGEQAITQEGHIHKEGIEGASVIRVQLDKTRRLSHRQQVDQSNQEEEEIAKEKITIRDQYGLQALHPPKVRNPGDRGARLQSRHELFRQSEGQGHTGAAYTINNVNIRLRRKEEIRLAIR
jgi:hypothetical protein